MIQLKRLIICALAMLIALSSASAERNPNAIIVLRNFDVPGAGNSTTPFGINERGDIVGFFVDAANVRRGFVRYASGQFQTIVAPGDTGNFTQALGINNRRQTVGDFFNTGDNAFHGYVKRGDNFSQFDYGGMVSTSLYGINDAGNMSGIFGGFGIFNTAFVRINGVSAPIIIPGAFTSAASDINNLNVVIGVYNDGAGQRGFVRHPNGALEYPIAYPGAVSTTLNGINDLGWIVGSYTDNQGRQHGFFHKRPNTFVSFDYPHAAGTPLNGINNFGFISGRYTDAGGVRHGFIAWIWRF